MSYHKFNESQRAQTVLKRLKQGEVVALISDAGMPGISDPGAELVIRSDCCTVLGTLLYGTLVHSSCGEFNTKNLK